MMPGSCGQGSAQTCAHAGSWLALRQSRSAPTIHLPQTLPGYRSARQRLYLSATLGTMDDLERRLGVAHVVNVLEDPVAENEVGRRLFLLNPGDEAQLDDTPVAFVSGAVRSYGPRRLVMFLHAERGRDWKYYCNRKPRYVPAPRRRRRRCARTVVRGPSGPARHRRTFRWTRLGRRLLRTSWFCLACQQRAPSSSGS